MRLERENDKADVRWQPTTCSTFFWLRIADRLWILPCNMLTIQCPNISTRIYELNLQTLKVFEMRCTCRASRPRGERNIELVQILVSVSEPLSYFLWASHRAILASSFFLRVAVSLSSFWFGFFGITLQARLKPAQRSHPHMTLSSFCFSRSSILRFARCFPLLSCAQHQSSSNPALDSPFSQSSNPQPPTASPPPPPHPPSISSPAPPPSINSAAKPSGSQTSTTSSVTPSHHQIPTSPASMPPLKT